jgi:ketosteroid isomerase-like protein
MSTVFTQINADIWLPFSQAYATGAVDRYLAIHAADFTYVQAGARIIEGLDDYSQRIRKSFADLAGRGVTFTIAFRFVERIASGRLASERGLFRLSGTGPKGPGPVRHGRFHTIARRDDAGWRLIVDYEYADVEPVAPADYEAAFAPDDVDRFA